MFCGCLRVMGLSLLLGCWLSTTRAADVAADSTPRGQAWAVLTRDPPEKDPAVLSRAILAVVCAGVPEDLDRLATYMQSDDFGKAFAIPPRPQLLAPTIGTCPFKELMRSIAECDTSFAEELLVLYAHSSFISPDWFRRSYVLQALGCLHPKTNGTYSLLDKDLMPPPRRQPEPIDGDAFQALVSIGDEARLGFSDGKCSPILESGPRPTCRASRKDATSPQTSNCCSRLPSRRPPQDCRSEF